MMFLWNLWHGIFSLIYPRKAIEYNEQEFQDVLFKETVREVAEETAEMVDADQPICQRRVGRITTLQTDYGLIDGKYYFDIWRLNKTNAKVGQTVQYYAYRTNANAEWKVTKVSVDEWEEGCSSDNPSAVLRECAVIQRVIPVKVEERQGKLLKLSSNLECNLEKTAADFLPIKGDWIELTVLAEISEDKNESLKDSIIEIQNIKARNSRIYCGEISHLRDGLGIINSEVHFRDDVCEPGYMPSINDLVLAKVIESEQGALVSRALLILPMSNVETGSTLMANIEQEALFSCKNGINISEECSKKNLIIGEQTMYNVKVENVGNETQIIKDVTFKNSLASRVMTLRDTEIFPYTLEPEQFVQLEVDAVASSPGFFSDILVLTFEGDWQVACLLDFFVDIEGQEVRMPPDADKMPLRKVNVRYERRKTAITELCATKNGFIIPGRKTIKAPPFLPTRLEHYPIPKLMEEIFMNDTNQKNADLEAELIKTYPFLVEELNPENYQSKFHMLLHLEDIETLVAIKKYDKERVSFDVHGDFLVMEIANLAESRPSLAVGDKLIATDPAVFKENNARYEGYIHKVSFDRIFLKFNESFQHSYNGKDYSVSFSHNRAGIRRCHQALNEVIKNLRFEWLFPNMLGSLKPTQINVIGEFPATFADAVHQCAVVPQKKPLHPMSKSRPISLKKDAFWMTEDDDDEENEDEASGDGPTPKRMSHEYSSISITSKVAEIKWQTRTPNKKLDKLKTEEPTPEKASKPVVKSAIMRKDKVLKWVNQDLNHFQREAVRNILKGEARPLPYIIFGPPGTGKTITVVETILQIAFLMEESRILVATPSNSSADLICERLISWNLSSMVPGNLTRLVGYNYMIDNRMSSVVKPFASVIDLNLSNNESIHYDADGIRFASRESVGRSKITVGTCVSLGSLYNLGFPKNHFTHIIIDEAGQSMEPEVLIPLAFMNDQTQAILAGDPRQLGPVVISTVAKLFGLGDSLLSRFLIRFPYHRDPESYPDTDGYDPRLVTRLLYNYRSLPEILDFYSSLFYDSKLKAQICGVCSPEADIVKKLKEALEENPANEVAGVIFYGIRGVNKQDEDSPSWYNDHEIFQITKYMITLYNMGMKASDIGIITPYQKQVMKIRDQLRYMDLDLPKVGTVEEFQGQERNVIIISTVRSDEGLIERDRKFALGFVASQQRLNVAISRARAMLIIIGNPHLLSKDLSWKRLLKMCMERRCYYGADLPISLLR